jgi:hypothetical protein
VLVRCAHVRAFMPSFIEGSRSDKWMVREIISTGCSKRPSARPQRVKTGGVPSGAHGATNKEHHVCARRRVSEAAGSPLRI